MNTNKTLKILFIGDISARPGRQVVRDLLPGIKKQNGVDVVIANCENAAGGRGVTREIINELESYGIDYFTTGEHVWDIAAFRKDLEDSTLPLVRPYNYERSSSIPGKGWDIIDLGSKGKLIITAFLGQEFMRQKVRNPFWSYEELLKEIEERTGEDTNKTPILVDFHAEATSEKASFGWNSKETATAVLGTHTHVGTIDNTLLPRNKAGENCAFVTDVGMCGSKDASLWVNFDSVIHNFKYPYKKSFKVEKEGLRIFNSVLIEMKGNSAKKITRVDRVA